MGRGGSEIAGLGWHHRGRRSREEEESGLIEALIEPVSRDDPYRR